MAREDTVIAALIGVALGAGVTYFVMKNKSSSASPPATASMVNPAPWPCDSTGYCRPAVPGAYGQHYCDPGSVSYDPYRRLCMN